MRLLSHPSRALRYGAVFACWTTAGCEATGVAVLGVVVELSSDTLVLSDSVSIRVVAMNRGGASIVINANRCPDKFRVLDQAGEWVGPAGQVCTLELSQTELAPGETFTFEYYWDGEGHSGLLAPGSYWVVGRWGSKLSEPRAIELVR